MSRYFAWCAKHRHPRKCEWCDYIHDGRLDYRNHMQEAHPEENKTFEKWCGLRSTTIDSAA